MIKAIVNIALFVVLLVIGTYVSIFAVFLYNPENNLLGFIAFILIAWGFAIVSRILIWIFRRRN